MSPGTIQELEGEAQPPQNNNIKRLRDVIKNGELLGKQMIENKAKCQIPRYQYLQSKHLTNVPAMKNRPK